VVRGAPLAERKGTAMSECEWAAAERQRLDQERVERVLDRITVRRRVYSPTRARRRYHWPAIARRRRFWMRVNWLDDHTGRHIVPWSCALARMYGRWKRGGWRRVKWIDDNVARHTIPWLCDAVMDGGWRRGS